MTKSVYVCGMLLKTILVVPVFNITEAIGEYVGPAGIYNTPYKEKRESVSIPPVLPTKNEIELITEVAK